MSDGIKLIMSKDGTFKEYDDTYDIVIHCESKEEHDRFIQKFNSMSWIPCSERLPVESGTYIVNAIENHIVHVTFAKWMPRMKRWDLTGSRSYWKVTAWMPLPEPYKGE